jgi:hypothetical protein
MPLKKILIILIILFFLALGTLLVYNLLLKKEPLTEPTTSRPTSGQMPTTGQMPQIISRLKAISQEPVLGPTIDGQKIKYYSAANGNVFKSNFDGSGLMRISSNILPGLLKVLWSPDKSKVIAIFKDGEQVKKYFYDYQTQRSVLLNQNIRYLAWSPAENKIVYQYYDPQTEDNNISIANPDGTQWTNILKTRMKNLIVEWPSLEQVSLRTRPSGLAQSVVYTIDLATNNFQKVINETYGLTILWSPLGNKILYSETSSEGKNLKLKIADLAKQTIKELNFVTLPEKCVWSKDNRTLFCAIPKTIPTTAILPDDYYKGLISFTDDFWRINLDTGEKIQLFETTSETESAYDAKELLLSPQENYLLFVNQKDGLLYSLAL